ncbi:hypothetical protein OROMI_024590 [Orobanche minor]
MAQQTTRIAINNRKSAHRIYDVVFFGDSIHTIVTYDPDIATQWISDVEHDNSGRILRLIVGLDVEWRPSFKRNTHNPAATLQLCVGGRCLIYQLIYSPSIPKSLTDFLANPNYTFVGIGIDDDLKRLQDDHAFGFNTVTVDLRGLAADKYGQSDLKNSGLKGLAKIVLEKDVEKPKKIRMSGWNKKRLTYDQVRYACVDAFVSFEIGRILNASSSSSSASG